jgi:hypothetical protein
MVEARTESCGSQRDRQRDQSGNCARRVRAGRKQKTQECSELGLEAPPGFEPGMEVLQTSALPLGDGADRM